MAGVLLLNVLDVARALGSAPTKATPEDVANWLLTEYVPRRGGGFNYNSAINATFDMFRGASSIDAAVLYCLTTGNPKGRRQNAEAIKCVAGYAIRNISKCYRIGFTAVAVGRIKGETVYIGIKAPMVRAYEKDIFVVMPGFRMSHRPVESEIDVACSIALANFGRDDFANADFEYLYAGPGLNGDRDFRSIKGRERKVYHRDDIDTFLDTYVKGVALAIEAGAKSERPNLRGYNIVDSRQPAFV
jgi:hypothetical protein